MFRIISENGKHMIKKYESCSLKAYQDVGGIWTIGYGWTGKVYNQDITCGMIISQGEADHFFNITINDVERFLNKFITVEINQHQFDALASLTYNIGVNAFHKSTLLKKLNTHDLSGAAEEILRWNKVAGQIVKGLRIRRESEYMLYNA